MKKRKVRTNGIEIMVHQYSSTGTPILFLHFISGNAFVWNGVVPAFTSCYQAYAIDMRGHGESDQPDYGYEIEVFAIDLLGVLDALELESVHLVGSSLGCYVALFFAATFPERVRSISLSDGAMQNHSGPRGKFATSRDEHIRQLQQPDLLFPSVSAYVQHEKQRRKAWNSLVEKAVLEGWASSLRVSEGGFLSPATTNHTYTQIMTALYDLKLEPLYAKIKCPVLFLPAAKHQFFEWKNQFIQRIISDLPFPSRSVILPETEHIMVFEHAASLCQVILMFLDQIDVNRLDT
ncbi:alpha/beta hydrolase [Brevibacillus reuszeri]|uniref:Alpha/beta hydrolase n=1 Tax=Brevibacillus reuszeri TaxID=54915 RepID=A0ABQ0TP49_9BACL|nr:alpha/beta hydrolase [Brevibacillus reuszeri]MED1858617.1 alpha/beta hydrolase [Brevibacillus reuszeri]GED69596.1 alpha/beta hydrolase [Brevibacillus reuszeri]